LILCALMNVTISAPSINLSISMLFRIPHILSVLTVPNTGCPNIQGVPTRAQDLNFLINAQFIRKLLIFLFQYKVHTLRLIVEHNIRQMSPTTLLSRGGRQCAHFKSCLIFGTPYVFLRICLSRMCRLFSSFAVKVKVCDEHVTTGLIIVLYIFILVFFIRNFDFINFALA
jgi:hypothetical protein